MGDNTSCINDSYLDKAESLVVRKCESCTRHSVLTLLHTLPQVTNLDSSQVLTHSLTVPPLCCSAHIGSMTRDQVIITSRSETSHLVPMILL